MLVPRGVWSPATVGQQIHVGPFYADSYAARNQMLIGQTGPAAVAAFRRPAGRFLSGLGGGGLGALDPSMLTRFKIGAGFAMPFQGLSLTGVTITALAPGEVAAPGQSALEWATQRCAAGARIFSDVHVGAIPGGNHLVASGDPRLSELLSSGTRVFGNQPMVEHNCPAPSTPPIIPPEPPPPGPAPGPTPAGPAIRGSTVIAIVGVLVAGAAGYYLLTRKRP